MHEQFRPAEFATELQLVAAEGVRQVVRHVPCSVGTA